MNIYSLIVGVVMWASIVCGVLSVSACSMTGIKEPMVGERVTYTITKERIQEWEAKK